MSIYIAHRRRKTYNALDTLVLLIYDAIFYFLSFSIVT